MEEFRCCPFKIFASFKGQSYFEQVLCTNFVRAGAPSIWHCQPFCCIRAPTDARSVPACSDDLECAAISNSASTDAVVVPSATGSSVNGGAVGKFSPVGHSVTASLGCC